jgi:Tfp pilus assembly protein PilO
MIDQLLIILFFLFVVVFGLAAWSSYLSKQIEELTEKNIKTQKELNDHRLTLVRLMYHVSIDIQDFETADKIVKTMPVHFDLNKFD